MTLPFYTSLFGLQCPEYRAKRKETVVFVNLDSPTSAPGAVIVGLLEPRRLDVMKKVLDANTILYGAICQTVLMTDVTPWLYIGVLVGGPSQSLVDAMNEQQRLADRD